MEHRKPHQHTLHTRAPAGAHELLPQGLYADPIDTLMSIARARDARHWNAETCTKIDRILIDAGFDIREPGGH